MQNRRYRFDCANIGNKVDLEADFEVLSFIWCAL